MQKKRHPHKYEELRPEWVDLPRAKRIKQSPLPSQLKPNPQEKLDCIATAHGESGCCPGHCRVVE